MSSDEEFVFDSDDSGSAYFDDNDSGEDNNSNDRSSNVETEIENAFFEADDLKNRRPAESLKLFKDVIQMEMNAGKSNHTFPALVMCAVLSSKLKLFNEATPFVVDIVSKASSATRSDFTSAITSILDSIPPFSTLDEPQGESLKSLLLTLMMSLHDTKLFMRLWFQAAMKYSTILLETKNAAELRKQVTLIRRTLADPSVNSHFGDSSSRSGFDLECHALEVQLCVLTNDIKQMNKIYPLAVRGQGSHVIADPKAMSVVREAGGKMMLAEKRYHDAYQELQKSFMLFQETGMLTKAKQVLRLVVLANMLSGSKVSPFDSQEAKAFEDDPVVAPIARLRTLYDAKDVSGLSLFLAQHQDDLVGDETVGPHLETFLREFRALVISQKLAPFSCARISSLVSLIGVKSSADVIDLLLKVNDSGEGPIAAGSLSIDEAADKVTVLKLEAQSDAPGALTAVRSSYSEIDGEISRKKALLEWANGICGSIKKMSMYSSHSSIERMYHAAKDRETGREMRGDYQAEAMFGAAAGYGQVHHRGAQPPSWDSDDDGMSVESA